MIRILSCKAYYSEADELAKQDDLTKTYNRRHFEKLLSDRLITCNRNLKPFYLVFFDSIDRSRFFERITELSASIKSTELEHEGDPVQVSASFGALEVKPGEFDRLDDIVQLADSAMFQVKRKKRGEVHIHN